MLNRKLCALQVMVVAVFMLLFAVPGMAQTNSGEFTVIALPDTQFYSASYPQIFTSQTQWIADNIDALNIKFVLGLGDIVDKGSDLTQWQNADAAVKLIEGKIPYFLPIGNRDYQSVSATTRKVTNFNTYFGPSRYAGYSWYRGNYAGSNENFYGEVNVNETSYLILALEFYPRDAVLAWADQILSANAGKEVIVITHSFTYKDSTRVDKCDDGVYTTYGNDGEAMWNKLFRKYSNIFLVLSGHISYTGRRSDLGEAGNLVNEVLSDYQSGENGGNGYLRILTFKPLLNQIDVKTYSPYLDAYMTDSANQFTMYYHAPAIAVATGGVDGKSRVDKVGSTIDCSTLTAVSVQAQFRSVSTNSSGKYALSNVAAGNYTVNGSKLNWQSQSQTVGIDAGYTARLDWFMKPNMGTISGKVTNSSGVAISGATVQFSGGIVPFSKSVTTNASGVYSSGQMSIGSYAVTVSKTGYTTLQQSATVTTDTNSAVNFNLQ
ncbi:MAG TPA: carboxypeptidase regulatory-like domain-containing protein [Clostridia bacterium]|nr:carboxypeptidase regulatory-like domain-containing protein [Clostridia bacterium]